MSQPQGGEAFRVRPLEGQAGQGKQIQRRAAGGQAFRVAHGVQNGQAHIRRAQLGDQRTVGELHPTVNDALGMNDHLNAVVLHAEKPLGFHDLQRLVEQGGAVDGDFLTHDPVGMLQRLCLGGAADGGFIPRAERPAGAGQDDLVDGIARRTLQTLENGAVLAVHRQEGMLARLPGCFHHQMAAGDQCFFIGQQHPFVLKEGFQYAFQARHAHHGHQHIVAVRLCGQRQTFRAEDPLAEFQVIRNFFH